MRRSRRHPLATDLRYAPRGMDCSLDPYRLPDKAGMIPWCENIVTQKGTGALRTLEPFELISLRNTSMTTLYASSLTPKIFFAQGSELYAYSNTTDLAAVKLGNLTGTRRPVFCDWESSTRKCVFVASGSTLQYYDVTANQFRTVSAGTLPKGSSVFVRNGRLVVCGDNDRVWYSGVGDPFNWQTEDIPQGDDTWDVWTEADALWIDVGYGEAGENVAMLPVSRDLLVFRKSTRGVSVYRISGEFPLWTVTRVASEIRLGGDDVVLANGDALFLDLDRGITSIGATTDYGDFAVSGSIGDPVNPYVVAHTTAPRVWCFPDRGEIWFKINTLEVFVYSTRYGVWTRLKFTLEPTAALEVDGKIWVAFGGSLCRMADGISSPFYRPACSMKLAPFWTPDHFAISRLSFRGSLDDETTATLAVGPVNMPLADRKSKWCNYLTKDFQPEITASGGTIVVNEVVLEVAET